MATPVKYKRPRKINVVSVSLAIIVGTAIYLAYQYFPLYMQKQEAYRVLEETGSAFAARKSYYREEPEARESLRRKMEADLRRVGLSDPELETWIEMEGLETWFGCAYTVEVHWPAEILETQRFDYEVEHHVVLP